jgi:hypothetical protein
MTKVCRHMLSDLKTLDEMIRELSPDAQRQVADLVRQLAKEPKLKPSARIGKRWIGGLREYRDQYTALELQKKALEWRGD